MSSDIGNAKLTLSAEGWSCGVPSVWGTRQVLQGHLSHPRHLALTLNAQALPSCLLGHSATGCSDFCPGWKPAVPGICLQVRSMNMHARSNLHELTCWILPAFTQNISIRCCVIPFRTSDLNGGSCDGGRSQARCHILGRQPGRGPSFSVRFPF